MSLTGTRQSEPRNSLPLRPSHIAVAVALAIAPAAHAHTPRKKTGRGSHARTINIGAVSARARALNTLSHLPSTRDVFRSTQSVKTIGKKQMAMAGPAGGSAQAMAAAPGVHIASDGASGAPRSSISINGMKTGWGNIAGNANDGTIMVTFDGVPMVDPAYGVWQASEVPQMALIRGMTVTYGPGYPVNRWYNNIGGSINFVPLQPGAKAGGSLGAFVGSFGTTGETFSAQTGDMGHGWSAVVAGGATHSDNFLNGYGFQNPAKNHADYAKLVHTFRGGHISFGAYTARSEAYRPLPIPVAPNAHVTVNGQEYSQPTTGFYTTLPASTYWKQSIVETNLLFSRLVESMSRNVTLHNLIWYRYGGREHQHYNTLSPSVLDQYYHTTSNTYGDKLYFAIHLPRNEVSVGGYYLTSRYYSLLEYYNPGMQTTVNGHTTNYSASLPYAFHSSYLYMTDLAAFVQDDIRPVRSLRITPGVRLVSFQTSFVNNAAAAFPTNTTYGVGHNGDVQPNSTTHFVDLEPSIGVNWQATPDVSLYANYSKAYKAPAGATGTYAHLLASSLQPQTSDQYQVGLKALIPRYGYLKHAVLGVNYYHLTDNNEIIPVPVVNHTYSLFASGSSQFSGVNLYFTDNPLYSLHLFSNLSFENATYLAYTNPHGVSYDGLPISNVPAQTANIGAYYEIYDAGALYEPRIWWQYTGTQDLYNNNTGAPTRQKLPAFGLFNAALNIKIAGHDLMSGLHTMSLDFGVLNILNKRYNAYEYISSGGYYGVAGQMLGEPGEPRSFYMSVDAKF